MVNSRSHSLLHRLLHLLHWIQIREFTVFLHYGATCVIVFRYLDPDDQPLYLVLESREVTLYLYMQFLNQTEALGNLTKKLEKEIGQVWRQMGIMYGQVSQVRWRRGIPF